MKDDAVRVGFRAPDCETEGPPRDSTAQATEKQPYSRLELVHYGSLAELTRAGTVGPFVDPFDPFSGSSIPP